MKTEKEIKEMFNDRLAMQKRIREKNPFAQNSNSNDNWELHVNGADLKRLRWVLDYWSDEPFKL